MTVDIICADAREALAEMGSDSVDAVVTDPPYGLEFMGKEWDRFAGGAVGGYANRLTPSWHSGSWQNKRCLKCGHIASGGSPCSCANPDWIVEVGKTNASALAQQAFHAAWAEAALRVLKPGGHLVAFGGTRTHHRLWCALEDAGFEIRDTLCWLYGSGFPKSLDVSKAIDKAAGVEREDLGESPNWRESKRDREKFGSMEVRGDNAGRVTAPATDAARQWDGWGTALKPAWEPIVLARKPLVGTVAANVQAHGTGALNVDGCRVEHEGDIANASGGGAGAEPHPAGRWPANVVLDEEAAATLGEASRFFYCAKASRAERGKGNNHPTVKPLALMRWLCRLVTPPNGLILDPFIGSGTTAVAAIAEGFRCVGIDSNPEYCEWARHRTAQRGLMLEAQ